MSAYYILDADDNVAEVDDVIAWGKWFEENPKKRQVGYNQKRDVVVSTVFLGLDHSFLEEAKPILFETKAFKNGAEVACERYSTRLEALKGHDEMALKYIK